MSKTYSSCHQKVSASWLWSLRRLFQWSRSVNCATCGCNHQVVLSEGLSSESIHRHHWNHLLNIASKVVLVHLTKSHFSTFPRFLNTLFTNACELQFRQNIYHLFLLFRKPMLSHQVEVGYLWAFFRRCLGLLLEMGYDQLWSIMDLNGPPMFKDTLYI